MKYCKHCGKPILDDNYVWGFGFIYHSICNAVIYGYFND